MAVLWAAFGGTSYGELLGIGLLLGAGGANFAVAGCRPGIPYGFFAKVVQEKPLSRSAASGTWWQAAWKMARVPSVYWLCLIYGMTFGGFVGLTSFLPVLLHEHYGSDPIAGGSIAALCGSMGSLIRPVGGYMADRWGGLRVLAGVFVLLALMSACPGSWDWPWSVQRRP